MITWHLDRESESRPALALPRPLLRLLRRGRDQARSYAARQHGHDHGRLNADAGDGPS